jgi:hypothetical protein
VHLQVKVPWRERERERHEQEERESWREGHRLVKMTEVLTMVGGLEEKNPWEPKYLPGLHAGAVSSTSIYGVLSMT